MTGKPQAAQWRLSWLSRAQGFTWWHYNARLAREVGPFVGIKGSKRVSERPQTLAECLASGFFDPLGPRFVVAADNTVLYINPGDMIAISASDGAALVWVEQTAPAVVVVAMGSTGLRGPIGKQQESKP